MIRPSTESAATVTMRTLTREGRKPGPLGNWRRRRAARRVKPGDGRPLQPFRWWHLLAERSLFHLRLVGPDGRGKVYAVDLRFWGRQGALSGKAHLYLDGRRQAESTLPAAFGVEGGTIEVAVSAYGPKRMHYVDAGGAEHQLVPDPASAVGRRLRLDRQHPALSRLIGVASVLMLIVGIGLNVLQVVEPVSAIPLLAERFGRFESPVRLPLWLNVALGLGVGFAATERALRLRYHPLLDGAGG